MQACRVPPASQETLLCMTRTLLNSTLGLEGLFEAAAAERDPVRPMHGCRHTWMAASCAQLPCCLVQLLSNTEA